MKNIIDNLDPPSFSLSAVAIGYILSNNLTPAEENAIGNWFMLAGQVLCTNASQKQVLNNSNTINSGDHIVNSNYSALKKSINTIDNELNNYF